MAFPWAALFLALALALASVSSSTCHVVKGSVSCLDCKNHDHLSDIRVLLKCEKVKQLAMTTTEKDGSFEAELTTDPASTNCQAQILGGPKQLCSYKKTVVSKIVKAHGSKSYYTIATPLAFSTSCPSKTKFPKSTSNAKSGTGGDPVFSSSKPTDFPPPDMWGLPPTNYFFPIVIPIGIP